MRVDDGLVLGLGLSKPTIERVHDIARAPDGRLHVAKSLGKLNLSYWHDIGSYLAGDPSSRVRGEVALSLGATGDREAVHLLDHLASDGTWQVRCSVALAASRHGSKAALPIIMKLLRDPVPQVRATAFRALMRSYVLHPEAASQEIEMAPDLLDLEARAETSSGSMLQARRMLTADPQVAYDGASYVHHKAELTTLESLFDTVSDYLEEESEGRPPSESARDEPGEGDKPLTRYVNSWFVGHPDPIEPLRFHREYQLGIEVSPKLRYGSRTRGRPDFPEPEFGDQDALEIVVAIVTDDFEVLEKPVKRMRLPKDRAQTSPTTTFKVKPIKNNQDVFITVLFYHRNNLFHEACIGARVQVLEDYEDTMPSAYFPTDNLLRRRATREALDVNLQVIEIEGGYRFILFYDFGDEQFDVMWFKIPITQDKLADLLKGVRDDIMDVVSMTGTLANGSIGRIFFDGEESTLPIREGRLPRLYQVDDQIYGRALEKLAQAGRKLYVNLFWPTKGSSQERKQASQVGETLRRLSSGQTLRIQVLSDAFFIPWNLFYDGDYPTNEITPEEFWGFKHVIEEMPYRIDQEETKDIICAEDIPLAVGMNINRTAIPRVLSDPQLTVPQPLQHKVQLVARFGEDDLLDALCGKGAHCQLEYFYCHARTQGSPQKDFDESYLGLTSANSGLTLEKIKLSTVGHRFSGSPLFILNACESAQMDGRFYDGFVPWFLGMGACTVVGSDAEVPSLFGAHFGAAVLKALWGGNPIGKALLALRKQFLSQYQNPLGLIYRSFGNVDVAFPDLSSEESL